MLTVLFWIAIIAVFWMPLVAIATITIGVIVAPFIIVLESVIDLLTGGKEMN
jgi:hypothetical protein